MSTPDPSAPDPNDLRSPYGSPGQPWAEQQSYGHPYGKAPAGTGSTLSRVYSFLMIWLTTALIMWFSSRLFGFERGDIGAAVVSLVVSLVAAIGITAWLRRRDG